MYIQNTTNRYRCFQVGAYRYNLSPAGQRGCTASVPDNAADDPSFRALLDSGKLAVVGGHEVARKVEEEARDAVREAQESKMQVVDYRRNTTVKNVVVKCAGTTKAGSRCACNVTVPVDEYDETRPYFCPRHRNEDPANFSKVGGEWVRDEAATAQAVVDAQ